MNTNLIVGALGVVALLVGVFLFFSGDNLVDINITSTVTPTRNPSITQGAIREFIITGINYRFSLSEMHVKRGDTVRVTFRSEEGRHDWTNDEFQARTNVLATGTQETIQFIADRVGTFEYYCSVGTHRILGMRGNLIVEE